MTASKDRFKAILSVYLIFRRGSKILMLRRRNTNYFDGFLSLPAGHVEQGESLQTAAIREALEEVGVTIEKTALQLVHVLSRPAIEDPLQTRLDFFYHVRDWQGELTNKELDKCSELLWCDPGHLPEDSVPEVKFAFENINDEIIESEFNWA